MIDRELELQKSRQQVSDLLTARKPEIGKQYSATRASVLANRKPLLDALSAQAGNTPELTASIYSQTRGLDRKLDSSLARGQFDQQKNRINLLYENLINVAREQGLSLQNAENFARDFLAQKKQQEFIASENELNRQQRLSQDVLANQYAQRGIDLQNMYQPSDNRNAALLSALLGTATAVGTNYYLNNRLKQQNTSVPQLSSTRPTNTIGQGYQPGSLRQGSGFVPRSYDPLIGV